MAEVVWAEEALSDLEAIGEYFDRTSLQYASVVVGKLYTLVERIAKHPKIGRQVPEVEHESLPNLMSLAIPMCWVGRLSLKALAFLYERWSTTTKPGIPLIGFSEEFRRSSGSRPRHISK